MLRERVILNSTIVWSGVSQWLTMNVQEAVKLWIKKPKRNLGFFVSVEDANGRVLDATDFIKGMNCDDPGKKSSVTTMLRCYSRCICKDSSSHKLFYSFRCSSLPECSCRPCSR